MLTDWLGWLIIGSAGVILMHNRETAKRDILTAKTSPIAHDEIDVTRWRHDGSQPITQRNGNQAPVEQEHPFF